MKTEAHDISACRAIFADRAESVLFVTSQLRPRELKMASGLRKLGWAVGLIYYKWTPFDPRHYFDFCVEAGSADEAHALARELAPRITHVFSGAIDDYVLRFCRQKPSPVVIDLNDVFAPSLFDYCHERFEPTREALARAEGLCARDLQAKSAERIDHFRLPPHALLFLEYCWNNGAGAKTPPEVRGQDEVHVVSVGTISLETQGMYDSCYLQLAKMLIAQHIHFHIYPHWAYRPDHSRSPHAVFEKDFADYLLFASRSPYLHVHESLPIEELAKVLPRYDFGIVAGGCSEFGQKLSFYHPRYLETCYSGRIADYLDARLPVLINDEVKFDYWLLKRYGAGVDLKGVLRPGFKQRLLDLKRDRRQGDSVAHAAQVLSVDRNSPRLAAFYRKIIAEGITDTTHCGAGVPDGGASSTATERSPERAEAKGFTGMHKPLTATLREYIQWAAPRAAKILLPYRAMRIFQVRLHNALQQNDADRLTIETLSGRVAALDQEKAELVARVERADHVTIETFETLSGRVTALDQEKTRLQRRVASLEQDRAKLESSLAALAREKSGLQNQVYDLERGRDGLQGRVASLEEDRANLESSLAVLAGEKSGLQNRVSDLERGRDGLRGRVAGLEKDRANLEGSLAVLAGEKSGLQNRVADLERDNRALHSRTNELQEQVQTLTVDNHLLSNDKFILESEKRIGDHPISEVAGILNWPELLNSVERVNGFSELVRMLRLFAEHRDVGDRSSRCWDVLGAKNLDQLLTSGYMNFKRTIGCNYFNFLVQGGDPQLAALEALLPPEVTRQCLDQARRIPDDPAVPCPDQTTYRYFVLLLWEYAKSLDTKQHLQQLAEPREGNPLLVPAGPDLASQDLANSLIEYYAMSEEVPFQDIERALEIGGGYGRNAFLLQSIHPGIQITLVDIPPALFLAQRYLSSVFPERRVFRVREFSQYRDVRQEMEACSLVFLMPHQLALLPEKRFDLSMNISSFGEMTKEQIAWYFERLSLLTGRYFYMKQWKTSRNIFDGTVLEEADYPSWPNHWRKIYSRPCPVQTEFFETLYRVE